MSPQEAARRLLGNSCLRDQPGSGRRRTSPSRFRASMEPHALHSWLEQAASTIVAAEPYFTASRHLEPGPARGLRAELVQQTRQRPVVHDYNLPDNASTPESSAARQ